MQARLGGKGPAGRKARKIEGRRGPERREAGTIPTFEGHQGIPRRGQRTKGTLWRTERAARGRANAGAGGPWGPIKIEDGGGRQQGATPMENPMGAGETLPL